MIEPCADEILWSLTKDNGRAEVVCVRLADALELQYLIDSHCYYTHRYGVVANERERALRDAREMREDFETRGWTDNSPAPATSGRDAMGLFRDMRPASARLSLLNPPGAPIA